MLHSINIFIHVLFGIIAIFIAIIPYASEKGGIVHRRYGRIFLFLIAVVVLTALNGVLFFRDRPFLTVVTLLSFYTSYSGYRVLKTKEKGFQSIDFGVMLLVFSIALYFVYNIKTANLLWDKKVIYYLLGYVFAIVGFDILRFFLPNLITIKKFWLYEHIYKITASFTALISAGIGTVFSAWKPYNQIVPAILSTFWLLFCLIYFPKKERDRHLINKKQQ